MIVLTMQRLSPGDLGAHIAGDRAWKCYSFPALAEKTQTFQRSDGTFSYRWVKGEALDSEHEDIAVFED